MDAIIAGHVCIDLTPGLQIHKPVESVSALMRPGALVDVAGLTVSPGGAVSNTGLSLARMGMEVGLIGRVGADPLADMLRRELLSAGVGSRGDGGPVAGGDAVEPGRGSARLELLEDPAAGTSYSVILPIPGLDRIFLHDSGANDNFSYADLVKGLARFSADDSAPEAQTRVSTAARTAATSPRLMHFGYPTAVASMYRAGPAPLRELLSAARERGMTVSIDFSLPDPDGEAAAAPWREILAAAMPLTDICFPSIEELSLMVDPTGFREREQRGTGAEAFSPDYGYTLAGELLALGAAVVVVKLGGRGLLLRWDPTAVERLQDTGAIVLAERLPALVAKPPTRDALGSIDALIVPSYPVETIVSATGAGDTAIAGFLAALLAGGSIVDAAETGCVAGRNAVTTVDAVSSVQPLTVMDKFRRTASRRCEVIFENNTAWQRREDGAFEHLSSTRTHSDMTAHRRTL